MFSTSLKAIWRHCSSICQPQHGSCRPRRNLQRAPEARKRNGAEWDQRRQKDVRHSRELRQLRLASFSLDKRQNDDFRERLLPSRTNFLLEKNKGKCRIHLLFPATSTLVNFKVMTSALKPIKSPCCQWSANLFKLHCERNAWLKMDSQCAR